MSYQTLDSRLHAAAARAEQLRALTPADLDLIYYLRVGARICDELPGFSTSLNAGEYAVHRAIHSELVQVCCEKGAGGAVEARSTGPLACLAVDVLDATDLSDLLTRCVPPLGEHYTAEDVRTARNRTELIRLLQWAAAAAAVVGYGSTNQLDTYMDTAVEVHAQARTPDDVRAIHDLALTWSGSRVELLDCISTITA